MKIFIFILLTIKFIMADYQAGYAGATFRYANNAYSKALGGALIAKGSIGFMPFENPANLSQTNKYEIGSSYFDLSLDRSIQIFSLSKKLPRGAGLGISFYRAGINNIEGRNYINQVTEVMSLSDYYGMLSFASTIRKFSIGLNIKVYGTNYYMQLPHSSRYFSNAVGLDIGLLYKYNTNLYIGLATKNIESIYRWNLSLKDIQTSNAIYNEKIPFKVSAGFWYKSSLKTNLYIQEDFIYLNDLGILGRFRFGLEYIIKSNYFLRIGLKQKKSYFLGSDGYNIFEPSFGFGLKRKRMVFDYSFDPGFEGEGLGHLFSLGFIL